MNGLLKLLMEGKCQTNESICDLFNYSGMIASVLLFLSPIYLITKAFSHGALYIQLLPHFLFLTVYLSSAFWSAITLYAWQNNGIMESWCSIMFLSSLANIVYFLFSLWVKISNFTLRLIIACLTISTYMAAFLTTYYTLDQDIFGIFDKIGTLLMLVTTLSLYQMVSKKYHFFIRIEILCCTLFQWICFLIYICLSAENPITQFSLAFYISIINLLLILGLIIWYFYLRQTTNHPSIRTIPQYSMHKNLPQSDHLQFSVAVSDSREELMIGMLLDEDDQSSIKTDNETHVSHTQTYTSTSIP